MKGIWLALISTALVLPVQMEAGTGTDAAVQADYSNPGLTPSHWTLTLHADGAGHFHSDRATVPPADAQAIEAPNVDRDIQVSGEFAAHVFQLAHQHKFFAEDCESHMKVAFQGWKELRYSGPDGEGACKFNYSKDKEIQALGDSLVAVAETILEGARLETLLQHDPLGLDKEIDYLVEAVGDGRAQQIGAIKGILERLAGDPAVMDKVRKRARVLLARSEG
jgi:hypothetical protein